MSKQFGVEILNDGGRVILSVGAIGKSFEVDIVADDDGIGVTISRDSVVMTECGIDYDQKHENE